MNKNILIVFGGGFLIALLVAMIVSSSIKSEPEAVNTNKIEVLVSNKKMELGYTLKNADMVWQEWPEANLFEGLIRREDNQKPIEALEGRLRRVVYASEPMQKSMLLSSDKGNIVASSLAAGNRAVAIEVSAASMVGGFIKPGDYVDVILSHSIKVNNDERLALQDTVKKYVTETILENVRVLAIDQNATTDEKDKVKVGRTVTLEVNSKGAEKLALVGQMGDLSLSLRGVGDTETIVGGGTYQPTTDVGASGILQEIVKRSETGGGKPKKIRIYSDQGVESIEVKK